MAVKNTILGGTDFTTPDARIKPTDLNDTFDASAGWIDSLGIMFKNYSQMLFNSALVGFDSGLYDDAGSSGTPDLKNIFYSTIGTNKTIPKTLIATNPYATYWTVGGGGGGTYTVADSGDGIIVSASESANSNVVGDLAGSEKLVTGTYFMDYTMTTAGSGSYIQLSIRDADGTDVLLHRVSDGADFANALRRLNIDKTGKTCNLTSLTDTTDTGISLATLNNAVDWYIKVYCAGVYGGSAVFTLAGFYDLATTTDYTFTLGTADATVTNAIASANTYLNGCTATYYLSADNGANYEAVTLNEVHNFTNTGTQLKLKVTLNKNGDDIPILYHYSMIYNLI